MDERQLFERFHSAFDAEPRPGMREQIRAALLSSAQARRGEAGATALNRRAIRQFGTPSLQWAAGLVAVLVLVALLASLLYSRGVLNRFAPAVPAPMACPLYPSPTPDVPLSSGDLQAVTGIPDPILMTPFDLAATIGTQRITLVRAYADSLTTALVFQLDPTSTRTWTLVLMHDDQGDKFSNGTGDYMSAGQTAFLVYTMPGPRGFGKDRIAHLEIYLGLLDSSGAQDQAAGTAMLPLSVCVHPSASLSVPPTFHLGAGTVTVQSIEITPAAMRIQAVLDGVDDPNAWAYYGGNYGKLGLYRVDPPCTPTPDNNVVDTTCLIAFTSGLSGPAISPLSGTSFIVNFGWLRPAAGNYRVVFRGNGTTHGFNLQIPALEGL